LLLLALVPTLVTLEQGYSQSVVTSTTVYTAKTTLYAQTNTVIATVTTGPPRAHYCFFDYVYGDYSSGEKMSGTVTSSVKINFYILTQQQIDRFSGTSCGYIPPGLLVKTDITSYSFDWTVPQDGRYYFVFYDVRTSQDFTYSFILWESSVATFTFYSTSYPPATSSTRLVSSSESPSTSSFNTSSPLSLTTQGSQTETILAVAVVVVLILAFVFLYARSRRQKPKQPRLDSYLKPKSDRVFCVHCGAENPSGNAYCGKCGRELVNP
jgi:hypothetical protein